ncbi:hypothetical protein [Sterolibacterium denitrificans]|nr:hypothetical protein [Sterolibacterium denitrificans]
MGAKSCIGAGSQPMNNNSQSGGSSMPETAARLKKGLKPTSQSGWDNNLRNKETIRPASLSLSR